MKAKSEISVVIPCYNSIDTIERALDSVLAQTVLPLEVILVDDCGQDDLSSFFESIKIKYRSSFDLKLLRAEVNSGAGSARNLGWNNAVGKYIAFLDSDDSWLPNKLEFQLEYFNKFPELQLLGSNHYVESNDGTLIEENLISSDSEYVDITRFKQLIKNRFATSTVILKRDIKFRFEEKKRYSEDFLLWNQIVLSNFKAIIITKHVAIYHKAMYGASGLSSHMSKMIDGELDTYRTLYSDKYYSYFNLTFLLVYSYIKYLRRLIKAKFR